MSAIHGMIEAAGYDVRSYLAGAMAGCVWTTIFAAVSGVFLYLVVWVAVLRRRTRRRITRRHLTRRSW